MKLWSLYNEEEKLRIDDLTVQQVKIVLLAISRRRMREWYACPQGKMEWVPLADVQEFQEEVAELQAQVVPFRKAAGAEDFAAAAPEPTPQLTVVDSETPVLVDETRSLATVTVDPAQTKERRTARRYARKWRFRCSIGEQDFSCETVDVSMTGLSLNKDLPKWVPRVFKAELVLGDNSVEILCEKISPRKVKLSGTENLDLLRRWIVNF